MYVQNQALYVQNQALYVQNQALYVQNQALYVQNQAFFHFDIQDVYKYSFLIIFLSCNQYVRRYGTHVNVH